MRISEKQVYRAWANRRTELKGLSIIWRGLCTWSVYTKEGDYWTNERIFKSNREVYDFLLFGK